MNMKVGRNEPCPCGSGKKFKKCCISKNDGFKNNEFKTSYRFESGSYGSIGAFIPSIACLKQIQIDESTYHFVLVKPEYTYPAEDMAGAQSEKDLEEAFKVKMNSDSDEVLAVELIKKGY
ncbi:MAG: SEC-C metal-binding domain-containing protein, partial [Euryarchaeota archaeon]|nr:SEC-C metal-binding domain-containing protein [Euryarchaeota archaeon]